MNRDRIQSSPKLQQSPVSATWGKLISGKAFLFTLVSAFLCSYLDCKSLLIHTGFLQQLSAPWLLCQEESDVHSRSFFPLNTGVFLDLTQLTIERWAAMVTSATTTRLAGRQAPDPVSLEHCVIRGFISGRLAHFPFHYFFEVQRAKGRLSVYGSLNKDN